MRHGESENNILLRARPEEYNKVKSNDPPLSSLGQDACLRLGKELKKMEVKVDRVMTTGHKRAIQSSQMVRDGYTNTSPNTSPSPTPLPLSLYLKAHEFKGINADGKCACGLDAEQMKQICPDLNFGHEREAGELAASSAGQGWFRKESIETLEELMERVKEVLREMRELHKKWSNETILLITHGHFISKMVAAVSC